MARPLAEKGKRPVVTSCPSALAASALGLRPSIYVYELPVKFNFWLMETRMHPQDCTYRRYVERQIREGLGFDGTPLKLFWRGKQQRDAEKDLARQQNHQG